MKFTSFFTCLNLVLLNSLSITETVAQQPAYQLWYTAPAKEWTDALPIGNGRIGAMVFAGVENDRIQFNEETLWTGAPRDYNRKGASNYLAEIRQLLFEGKQSEAEKLAGEKFMGLQSATGDRASWVADMKALKGISGNPAAENYDDQQWKSIQVPSYEGWETVGLQGIDGAVWLRTTFDVPENWLGKNLVLDLNRIRDQDFTYLNGTLIGNMDGTSARKYTIRASFVIKVKNKLAVDVLIFFDKGGIEGFKYTGRGIAFYLE